MNFLSLQFMVYCKVQVMVEIVPNRGIGIYTIRLLINPTEKPGIKKKKEKIQDNKLQIQ